MHLVLAQAYRDVFEQLWEDDFSDNLAIYDDATCIYTKRYKPGIWDEAAELHIETGARADDIAKQLQQQYWEKSLLAAQRIHRNELEEDFAVWAEVLEASDGQDCWRGMHLLPGTDPTELDRLGIFWSYEPELARPYLGLHRSGFLATFHGRIDLDQVDVVETLRANLRIGEAEAEIRFFPQRPIFVYSVALDDGTVVDINDWRRT